MSSFLLQSCCLRWQASHRSLSGESDKAVVRELRKQGLTPVYVGLEQKKSFELKLPELYRARSRDILFFTSRAFDPTQRGCALDRALSITAS